MTDPTTVAYSARDAYNLAYGACTRAAAAVRVARNAWLDSIWTRRRADANSELDVYVAALADHASALSARAAAVVACDRAYAEIDAYAAKEI